MPALRYLTLRRQLWMHWALPHPPPPPATALLPCFRVIPAGLPRYLWLWYPAHEDAMDDLLDRITINPNQCGGRPCIRGMRIRVSDVLDLLAAGQSHQEILDAYPYLEADDIAASLRYAARRLDHPTLAA